MSSFTATQNAKWKTISRKDREFVSYLDGSFSSTEFALPVRSLNVGSLLEQVTFEIVQREKIARPSRARVLLTLARPASLVFSFAPMMAVWFFNLSSHATPTTNLFGPLLAMAGVIVFHAAVNFFNDYGDHMRGEDRLRSHGGSRVIQRGWMRARDVKLLAWILVALTALCGLPTLLASPAVAIAGVVVLVALEFAFQRLRLKKRGWAEILAFVLTGPMLAGAFSYVLGIAPNLSILTLGCIYGSVALLYFHAANFENIMPDSQAGVATWATRAGFDASKQFFLFVSLVILGSSLAFMFTLPDKQSLPLLPLIFAQAWFLLTANLRVMRLKSPLSSELVGLRFEAVKLSWLTLATMIGGFLCLRWS